MICCECYVKSVTAEEPGFRVEFERYRSLSIENDRRLQRGYYFANPSDYEEEPTAEPEE